MEIYVQRDAPGQIRTALRDSPVVPAGIRVRSELADGWTIHDGPQVTVTNAGTPGEGYATSTENVHVAVYAKYEPEARDLARIIDAYLLNPHATWGFSISPGPGLLCARDEDTGAWVCSVTVVAGSPKEGVML